MVSAKSVAQSVGWRLVRSGMIAGEFNSLETLRKHAYLQKLLKRLRVNCVIDIGANRGYYARSLRRGGFKGRIFCFEPIQADYAEIVQKARGDELWKAFNVALSSEEGERPFNVVKASWDGRSVETVFSSFLNLRKIGNTAQPEERPADGHQLEKLLPGSVASEQELVPVRRLDNYLPEVVENVEAMRVFLKMDTQGHDLEVFKGCSGLLKHIVGIQSEISVVPIYEGMPHYTDALDVYESAGFSLMNLHVVTRTAGDAVLEYDCLMARPEELAS